MIAKRINYILISMFSIIILVFGFYFINNMDSSYAYEVNKPTYPTETFTTDYNGNPVNYILNALTSNSSSSNLSDNFSVPNVLKISPNRNVLYVLQKNLEVPGSTEMFELLDDNKNAISDTGVKYIISHGYNTSNNLNHVFTDSSEYGNASVEQKYYVTQIALWLYLYENKTKFSTMCENNACEFLTNSNTATTSAQVRKVINDCSKYSGYKYLKYITDLVDNANAYKGNTQESKIETSSNTTYTVTSNLLTTSLITPSVLQNADNFMYYSFEIDDPDNYGVYLTDNSGNRLSSTGIYREGLAFKININLPKDLSKVNLENVKIIINGHFMLDTNLNYYRVTKSDNGLLLPAPDKTQRYSNVLFAYAQDDVHSYQISIKNFIMIDKVDSVNGDLVAGAKLKIVDKNDSSKVVNFVSKDDRPLFHALENGEYQLCETEAPSGYKLNENCIDFSVDGSHIIHLVMKNQPNTDVSIPDTGSFMNYIKYILGFILICIGLGVFAISFKNRTQS